MCLITCCERVAGWPKGPLFLFDLIFVYRIDVLTCDCPAAAFVSTVADALRIISQLQDVDKEVQRMRQEKVVTAETELTMGDATRPLERRYTYRSPSFMQPLRRRDRKSTRLNAS